MKVFLSGANGFLGKYFLKKSNSKIDFQPLLRDSICSLDFANALVLCHACVASGNIQPESFELFSANVDYTKKIIQNILNTPIVYVSTVSSYFVNQDIIFEDSQVLPITEYSISKFWGERIVLGTNNSVIVRFSSLYGIGMKENTLIPIYVKQALENKQIEVWGNGDRIQNYLHVKDAVLLISAILTNGKYDNTVYLGVSKNEYSNLEIAQIISKYTGAEIVKVNKDTSSSYRYNNEWTRNQLNWSEAISIEEGIKEYIEWKRKQY